ncbi:MAG: GTP 3',8-cyclase MoaA [Candidatus Puniceispirillaceae bacterium]
MKNDNNALIDPFGRIVDYIRLSVTDRCDFRCVYCMAEEMTFLPKSELLSLEELEQITETFISLGTRKIRLTGGEPLVRRNIMQLIQSLGDKVRAGRLDEVTLTTNGSQLEKMADHLYQAGVRRLNISLDSRDPDSFKKITRWGDLSKVMSGLEAAKKAGLQLKINMVALKGVNDNEFADMLRWCGAEGFDLTIIEVMPMGDIGSESRLDQYLPLSDVKALLEEEFTLSESAHKTAGPARYYEVAETGGRLGFITPLTHNFCEGCNRVRMTCTGELYMCLGQDDKADLAKALRQGGPDTLRQTILDAIARKPKGHDFEISRQKSGPAVARHMNVTGG